MKKDFKIIGFDADDTLWVNETFYYEKEKQFSELLSGFIPADTVIEELFKTEMQNLSLYGYGSKGFTLSMIETALRISENNVSAETLGKIIEFGKDLLNKPILLLDGVRKVLDFFHKKGDKLIIVTKGDLLDQERKLKKSNLENYFHHIEIMSDKKESDYLKLFSHLGIKPEDFLMIGNSMKSDIIPILNIGGSAIHIPYKITWEHEKIGKPENSNNYNVVKHISEIIKIFDG